MLRTLHLNGTRIRFAQLPEDIRQNQRIHVDIRPVEIVVLPALRGNNHAQNTHTQSVHASASQSATILKNNNQALNIDQAYDQLSAWVNQLPIENAAIEEGYANEAYKNQAAKEWIQHPTHLDHIDPASGISIKEFLALAWTAIHDDAQRDPTALLDDAQESLRDTLYEIKRGYNLSDAHKPTDNGQASVNICAGGTFNKIAEKLVSVVKGASLSMITRETFALSLENTIRKAAMDAVDEDPKLAESLANNEGILTEDIWNAIEGQVSSEVRAEFKAQSHIAGKSIDQLLNEHTQFEGTLEYFEVIPANKAA